MKGKKFKFPKGEKSMYQANNGYKRFKNDC